MPENSLQLVKVTVKNPADIHATLECFDREGPHAKWNPPVLSFPVVIGKHGLAAAGEKKEGDHKTPSGIFPITSAFGYAASRETQWIHMPYLHCSGSTLCVDDPDSMYYNWIVDENEVEKDWNSAERMRREDDLYKWGLVIGYNTKKTVYGAGSAIFMHLWRSDAEGTEGCVAMEKSDMLKLLKWLEEEKRPMVEIKA